MVGPLIEALPEMVFVPASSSLRAAQMTHKGSLAPTGTQVLSPHHCRSMPPPSVDPVSKPGSPSSLVLMDPVPRHALT